MKHFYNNVLLITFLFLSLVGCQSEETDSSTPEPEPEKKTQVLLSVDFGDFFTGDVKGYLAAYTPEGELLNYGSLADSLKWDLKGKYNGDKIDVLFFQVVNGLTITHVKNIDVGKTFTNLTNINPYQNTGTYTFKFKIEDFGKRTGDGTPENGFPNAAYLGNSGYATFNQLSWTKIENGYTYANITFYKSNDPKEIEYGTELVVFEKNTNKPYVKYLDLKTLLQNYNTNEFITLNKTDFKPAELKEIQVNAGNSEYQNLFLYTYNTQQDRRDIVRSFNDIVEGNKIWYIGSNDEMPISRWEFIYSAKDKKTSYVIESNKKEIPSVINKQELTGHTIVKEGDQFSIKHPTILPDKTFRESYLTLFKFGSPIFTYNFHLNSSESVGTSKLKPFKIPSELLAKFQKFSEIDKLEWQAGYYNQIYDSRPTQDAALLTLNSVLGVKGVSSGSEYIKETYAVKL